MTLMNMMVAFAKKTGIIKSEAIKKCTNKIVFNVFPDEIETNVGNSRFCYRPKKDGLWYLNYSDAELGLEKVFQENLNKGDTFVDIGAYIGYYSILASNIVGESGKIVSFEPNAESYRMLVKNIQLNCFQNCVHENIALSDVEGGLRLFIGKYTDGSSSLFLADEVNGDRYITVKAMTFDKYCDLYKIVPNFIKIDVEGAEYEDCLYFDSM